MEDECKLICSLTGKTMGAMMSTGLLAADPYSMPLEIAKLEKKRREDYYGIQVSMTLYIIFLLCIIFVLIFYEPAPRRRGIYG